MRDLNFRETTMVMPNFRTRGTNFRIDLTSSANFLWFWCLESILCNVIGIYMVVSTKRDPGPGNNWCPLYFVFARTYLASNYMSIKWFFWSVYMCSLWPCMVHSVDMVFLLFHIILIILLSFLMCELFICEVQKRPFKRIDNASPTVSDWQREPNPVCSSSLSRFLASGSVRG
jgi:hypothetical protein